MSARTLARLDSDAKRRGEAKARTAELLIEEGLRMEDHPGILFRDGPAGRRAAIAGGPDVWEVVETLKGTELAGEQAIAATAEWGNLSHAQVRMAVRYTQTPRRWTSESPTTELKPTVNRRRGSERRQHSLEAPAR